MLTSINDYQFNVELNNVSG